MAEKRRATTFRTSKGTIVNVQYPDIYVSPAFLSTEDVTNPTEMREALREEHLKEGITWFANSMDGPIPSYSAATRRPPFVVGDPHDVIYGPTGDTVVVCDGALQSIYEMRKEDYGINWEISFLGAPSAIDYSPALNRYIALVPTVAGVTGQRVIEIDPTTTPPTIVNSITATALGPINAGLFGCKVKYYTPDPTKFWLCATDNYVVVLTNWAGVITWQFGVYGVPGTDDTHLTDPVSVDAWYPSYGTRVWIGDYNRILFLTYAPISIAYRFPYPGPRIRAHSRLFIGLGSVSDPHLAISTIINERLRPMYVFPRASNVVSIHPTKMLALFTWEQALYEVDLGLMPRRGRDFLLDVTVPIFSAEGVGAGLTVNSYPVPIWGYKGKTLKIVLTQNGTATIATPRLTGGPSGEWIATQTWDTFDTLTLVANTPLIYSTEALKHIFRLSVTNTSLNVAAVDATLELEP